MYLYADYAIPEVQDRCDSAGEPPELLFGIPEASRGLDDGVQGSLMWLRLQIHHLCCARPDWLAADQQFDCRVANLALCIGTVTNANQGVTVPTREFNCPAVTRRQRLDDAMGTAFCLHWRWQRNTVGCKYALAFGSRRTVVPMAMHGCQPQDLAIGSSAGSPRDGHHQAPGPWVPGNHARPSIARHPAPRPRARIPCRYCPAASAALAERAAAAS